MKVKKRSIAYFVLLVMIITLIFYPATQSFSEIKGYSNKKDTPLDLKALSPSAGNNNDIIDSVFNAKIEDYNNHSYYSQVYESSLQATYYALYILNVLGKLDTINQSTMVNYILSHYEPSSDRFMDSLSYRYLTIDVTRDCLIVIML